MIFCIFSDSNCVIFRHWLQIWQVWHKYGITRHYHKSTVISQSYVWKPSPAMRYLNVFVRNPDHHCENLNVISLPKFWKPWPPTGESLWDFTTSVLETLTISRRIPLWFHYNSFGNPDYHCENSLWFHYNTCRFGNPDHHCENLNVISSQ